MNKGIGISKTDKSWIDGFFAGYVSGQEAEIVSQWKYVLKRLKQAKKDKNEI